MFYNNTCIISASKCVISTKFIVWLQNLVAQSEHHILQFTLFSLKRTQLLAAWERILRWKLFSLMQNVQMYKILQVSWKKKKNSVTTHPWADVFLCSHNLLPEQCRVVPSSQAFSSSSTVLSSSAFLTTNSSLWLWQAPPWAWLSTDTWPLPETKTEMRKNTEAHWEC